MHHSPRILLCGDTGISIEFGDRIDPEINDRVRSLFIRLKTEAHPGILDLNPTYRSLFIHYDPFVCSFEKLVQLVSESQDPRDVTSAETSIMEIPVCYGGDFGPDLNEVAALHGFDAEEVIRLHTAPLYRVYMIGFTPGFAYLGGLDQRLHTPRKSEPRKKVVAGSIGIADQQTGIYPIESPGGWQLIGRTPLRLFDPSRDVPFLLEAGDMVRFKPIAGEEFEKYSDY